MPFSCSNCLNRFISDLLAAWLSLSVDRGIGNLLVLEHKHYKHRHLQRISKVDTSPTTDTQSLKTIVSISSYESGSSLGGTLTVRTESACGINLDTRWIKRDTATKTQTAYGKSCGIIQSVIGIKWGDSDVTRKILARELPTRFCGPYDSIRPAPVSTSR